MLKKAFLFCLASLSFTGIAYAENTPQHYFQIYPTDIDWPKWNWLEVKIEINGAPHTVTFNSANPYIFPLSEIDMSKQGLIQVTEVRYQVSETGVIFTMPFTDVIACRVQISPKNDYPDSTISRLSVSTTSCAGIHLHPYTETISE